MSVIGEIHSNSVNGESSVGSSDSARKIDAHALMSVNVLLFSVGGVHLGIDADQVAEIAAYKGEKAEDLFWFHEEMGYGETAVTYDSPTVITIRDGGALSYRVIIDSMEDITEFGLNEISLFPSLLEPLVLQRGMWGVLHQNTRMVLLIDIKRMLREKIRN